MCYNEFFSVIEKRLRGLPQDDLKKSMDYYGEMIADRMEDGLNEEEAVAALGSVDDIVYDIADGASIVSIVKSKVKPKKTLKAWQTVLIILGSPIWLSLIVAVLAVFLCAYVVLWSAVFTLYAVTLSAAVSALGCLLGSAALLFTGYPLQGALALGAFLVCVGLTIPLLFLSNRVAKGAVLLSKNILRGIKRRFVVKEEKSI